MGRKNVAILFLTCVLESGVDYGHCPPERLSCGWN